MPHSTLHHIANAVNPLLALTALTFAFVRSREAREALPPWRFVSGLLLGLVVVYLLQNIDSRLHIWHHFGMDYSTHSAFAASVAMSLVVANRRWLYAMIPLFLAYAWLMLYLHFHTVADEGTATVLLVPATWALHRWLGNGVQLNAPSAET